MMFGGFEKHLFAARLQSFDRSSQKDFRLSSAALKTLNIYLAFIDGENLANDGFLSIMKSITYT